VSGPGPGPEHESLQDVREHGRDWEVCNDCGAQWDADGEQVTDGDGFCADAAGTEDY
jgi:hypothetical protein